MHGKAGKGCRSIPGEAELSSVLPRPAGQGCRWLDTRDRDQRLAQGSRRRRSPHLEQCSMAGNSVGQAGSFLLLLPGKALRKRDTQEEQAQNASASLGIS